VTNLYVFPEPFRAPMGRKKRILVVDDDVGIQELLELALEGEGYAVTTARDGVEALERLEATMPDLVVLDLMMPRLDGLGFITELSRRGLRSRVPVLVLTAAGKGNQRYHGLGAEAYIDKPFSLPELLDEVARLAT
jgi:two-component system, OmpR family, response regulator MprA